MKLRASGSTSGSLKSGCASKEYVDKGWVDSATLDAMPADSALRTSAAVFSPFPNRVSCFCVARFDGRDSSAHSVPQAANVRQIHATHNGLSATWFMVHPH